MEAKTRFVTNWADLATRLDVSRRIIQEWRKHPELGPKCPADKADGRKEVARWEAFMVENQLKRADEFVGALSGPVRIKVDEEVKEGFFPPGSASDWQKKLLEQKVAQAEIETAKQKGKLLVAAELEVAIGQMLAGIATALNHFPGATARFLVGLKDIHLVQQRLEGEINAVLIRVNACRYLEECLDEVVNDLPADPDARGLLELVDFGGQDKRALLDIVRMVARKSLAGVGRRALGDVSITSAGEISHAVTGQVTSEAEEAQRVTRNTAAAAPAEVDAGCHDAVGQDKPRKLQRKTAKLQRTAAKTKRKKKGLRSLR